MLHGILYKCHLYICSELTISVLKNPTTRLFPVEISMVRARLRESFYTGLETYGEVKGIFHVLFYSIIYNMYLL